MTIGSDIVRRYGVRQSGGFWEVVEYQRNPVTLVFGYKEFQSHVIKGGLDLFEHAVWQLVFCVIEAEWWQAAEQLTSCLIEEEQQERDYEKKRWLEQEKRKKAVTAEQKKILKLLRARRPSPARETPG